MSNFKCEKCGKAIIDSSKGYVTECEHYPIHNPKDLFTKECESCKYFKIQYLDAFCYKNKNKPVSVPRLPEVPKYYDKTTGFCKYFKKKQLEFKF